MENENRDAVKAQGQISTFFGLDKPPPDGRVLKLSNLTWLGKGLAI